MAGFIFEGNPLALYSNPLAVAPAADGIATDIGANVVYGADSVVCGIDSGIRMNLSTLTNTALESNCQFTIFIENQYCAANSVLDGSQGLTPATTQAVWVNGSNFPQTGTFGRFLMQQSGGVEPNAFIELNVVDSNRTPRFSTADADVDELIPITTVIHDGVYDIYRNYKLVVSGFTFTSFTDMWDNISIVSEGTTPGRTLLGAKSSRFSIASTIPTFNDLGAWMSLGDSFSLLGELQIDKTGFSMGAPYFDCTTENMIQGFARKNLVGEFTFDNQGVGGERTAQIEARTQAALDAGNPKIVAVHAGTNDAALDVTVSPNQEADYLSILTLCVNHPSVELIIYETITTIKSSSIFDTAPKVANVAEVNANIESAVATLGSSKVIKSDLFTDLGGESPAITSGPNAQFMGFVNGANDNLHLSSKGMLIEAENAFAIYDGFFNAVIPELIIPYKNLFNSNGDVVAVDLGSNWTNATGLFVTGLPDGLIMNTNTGIVTGTITQSGDFQPVITATNSFVPGIGFAPTGSFHWYVGPQARMFTKLDSIGTNATWFSFKEKDLTLAELDDAFFSNQYVASVLSTGDVLTITGSDGQKIVNVTVIKQSRTVTLSSGLTIA